MNRSNSRNSLFLVVLVLATYPMGSIQGGDRLTLENVPEVEKISAQEPFAETFSVQKACVALDAAALEWQKKRSCGACHTNFAHMMARPFFEKTQPSPPEIRWFFEQMVEKRWPNQGPRWPAEVICVATTLASHDRATTGKLHPATRSALERMWTLQRADGGWDWLLCGWPPMESDDHYGVTFAALGVGLAPENYAQSPAARKGMAGIRDYLQRHPAPSLHHRAMLAWAAHYTPELQTTVERQKTLDELLALQRPDGGWATASLLAGWKDHRRKDKLPQSLDVGDGYGTGFVVYLARLQGLPNEDPRLTRALDWIKRHQRASGRWFTPSPTKDSKHYISNVGSAFILMALESSGQVE